MDKILAISSDAHSWLQLIVELLVLIFIATFITNKIKKNDSIKSEASNQIKFLKSQCQNIRNLWIQYTLKPSENYFFLISKELFIFNQDLNNFTTWLKNSNLHCNIFSKGRFATLYDKLYNIDLELIMVQFENEKHQEAEVINHEFLSILNKFQQTLDSYSSAIILRDSKPFWKFWK